MGVTNYIWDPVDDNVIMETDENDDTIATYTHEPGLHSELISMHRDGQSYYYDYDGEGNTVAVTDENQNVVEEASYTAFGEVVEKTSSIVNPFGYKGALGYYTNEETNDIYVRARTYCPTIGRWQSADPLQFDDGPNRYLYVADDPINNADATGLLCFSHANPKQPGTYQGCGNGEFAINFKTSKNQDAWIVQEVEMVFQSWNCDGSHKTRTTSCPSSFTDIDGPPEVLIYYELFLMKGGQAYAATYSDPTGGIISTKPLLGSPLTPHDTFKFSGGGPDTFAPAVHEGYAYIAIGSVQVYPLEKYPLPPGGKKHFRPNNVLASGGISSSCDPPPGFKKGSVETFRFLGMKPWNCCDCAVRINPNPGTCDKPSKRADCMKIGVAKHEC